MAKKYASYEEVLCLYKGKENYEIEKVTFKCHLSDTESAFKFKNTLGKHFFIVEALQEGFKITGVNTSGHETSSTIITEKHTLGYDCGEVWRILKPEYIRDPLKKVLAQFKLSKNRIHWVNKEYTWKWDMSYTRIEEPGYASFSSGEKPDKFTVFGFSTIHHLYDGSIGQNYKMGDFYIVKGTPINKVVSFITAVMENDHNNIIFTGREKCVVGTKCAFTTHHDPSTGSYEVVNNL